MGQIVQVTIGRYWYELPDLTLHGQFDNLVLNNGAANQTNSISMSINDNCAYTHYFNRHTVSGEGAGVAAGTFFLGEDRWPERYRGAVIYFEAQEKYRNTYTGFKLDEQRVRKWRKEFRIDWEQKVLRKPEILPRRGYLWVTAALFVAS